MDKNTGDITMSLQLLDAAGESFARWSIVNDVVVIKPYRVVSFRERMEALRGLVLANKAAGHDYSVKTSFPEAVLWFNAGFTATSEDGFHGVRRAVDTLGKKTWVDLTFTASLTGRNEEFIVKNTKPRKIGFHEHFNFKHADTRGVYPRVYYTLMLANYVAWKQWDYFDQKYFSAVKILQNEPRRQMAVEIEETGGLYYVALTGFPTAYLQDEGGEEKLQKVIDDVQEVAFSIGLGGYVSVKCYDDQAGILITKGYRLIADDGEGYGTYAQTDKERRVLLRQLTAELPVL